MILLVLPSLEGEPLDANSASSRKRWKSRRLRIAALIACVGTGVGLLGFTLLPEAVRWIDRVVMFRDIAPLGDDFEIFMVGSRRFYIQYAPTAEQVIPRLEDLSGQIAWVAIVDQHTIAGLVVGAHPDDSRYYFLARGSDPSGWRTFPDESALEAHLEECYGKSIADLQRRSPSEWL